jgi:hypothetical protein
MNGVVAAQAVKLGEFTRGSRQGVVDADHAKLGVEVVDSPDGAAQRVCIDPAHPVGQRGRGACLWVDEMTGCDMASSVPELLGEVRSLLGKDELDERGRIEVGDQRRCSATRSDTGPSD